MSLADDYILHIKTEGQVRLKLDTGNWLDLKEVLHVPDLGSNLFSVSHAVGLRARFEFKPKSGQCRIMVDGEVQGTEKLEKGLWIMGSKSKSEVRNTKKKG